MMRDQKILSLCHGHNNSVLSLSYSQKYLASGDESGNICLWSPTEENVPISSVSCLDSCNALKYSVNNSNILYSAHGRQVFSWDIRSLKNPTKEFLVNNDEINCLDILPEEPYIAACDDSGELKIICTTTSEVTKTLKRHENICSAVCFRPNQPNQIISGGLDCRMVASEWRGCKKCVVIFEMGELIRSNITGEIARTLNPNEPAPLCPDRFLASNDVEDEDEMSAASEDSQVCSSDDLSEEEEEEYEYAHDTSAVVPVNRRVHSEFQTSETEEHVASAWTFGLPINPPMINSMACSNTGRYLATGLQSNTVEIFAGENKNLTHTDSLYGHQSGVSALLFINDSHIVTGGNDCNLITWSLDADGASNRINIGFKVDALAGETLSKVFIADTSPNIRMMDLTL